MFSKAAVQLHHPQNNNVLKWLLPQRGIVELTVSWYFDYDIWLYCLLSTLHTHTHTPVFILAEAEVLQSGFTRHLLHEYVASVATPH